MAAMIRNNAGMIRLALVALATLAGCAATVEIQGHRGARGLAPENTLPAFERALAVGVDVLEMDVGVTRDGVVVVAHDAVLNANLARMPDGAWIEGAGPAIHDLGYAELARYDVGRIRPGTAYAHAFPEQVPADGTRIPRLEEVFALVRRARDTRVRFNIETKLSPLAPAETLAPEPFARALVAEIRRGGMARRSTIQSFDWRTLQVVRREAPEIATVYLTARRKFLDNVCTGPAAGTPAAPAACEPSPWTAGFQLREHGSVPAMVRAAGGDVWSPFHEDLDAAAVREAHALGLRVVAWTVNDEERARALVEMGVDGLITDRPDRLTPLVRGRAAR